MAESTLRVVIADDEPITRMDLKELLRTKGIRWLGKLETVFDAIEACKSLKPDLVLIDIKMPLLDGLSAARIMNEERCGATIVLLTAYSEREFIDSAKEIGGKRVSGSSPLMKNPSFPVLNWPWPAAVKFERSRMTLQRLKSVWKAGP